MSLRSDAGLRLGALYASWLAVAALSGCGGGSDAGATVESSPGTTVAQAPAPAPAQTSSSGSSSTATAYTATGHMPQIDVSKIPSGNTGVSVERIASTSEQPTYLDGTGNFRTVCDYSHMSADDPIVYPGQPGRAHMHTFFGNTGANAHTTQATITVSGNSTCRGGTINRSSYWVPTMVDTRDGTPLRPSESHFYYKSGYVVSATAMRNFPAGLRMIAGNASATAANDIAKFSCHNSSDETWKSSIPNCPAGSELWQNIRFPQCWDGTNLDSPDHKSHMAYPSNGSCPSSHPVALPEITFNIVYPVREANAPQRWRLSSDNYATSQPGGYSSHGDWFNGWKTDIVNTFVSNCLRAAVDCHSHLLGDGRAIF